MIDISTYRVRVGCYNLTNRGKTHSSMDMSNSKLFFYKFSPDLFVTTTFPSFNSSDGSCTLTKVDGSKHLSNPVFLFLSYFYLIFLLSIVSLIQLSAGLPASRYTVLSLSFDFGHKTKNLSFLCMTLVKVAYLCLLSNIATKPSFTNFSYFKSKKRFNKFLNFLMLSILLLNFLMVAICNPSLLNPGPKYLSIHYQNVQGLIPFSQLSKNHPQLDHTKIFELNAHIDTKVPDILILNETWLKKSIKDPEIIQNSNYDVYRNDRSQVSHPADPNNPKKFRKFGGGVLIAIRSNIDASFKRISVRKGAEMIALEVTIGQNKYVFCTVYRVGTLGEKNHESIVQSIKSLYQGRTLKKIFIIGDLNLSSVTWPINDGAIHNFNRIDKLFVDSFSELGLNQHVTEPTHIKGKTLDILLSNQSPLINDVKVINHSHICNSDHFPIHFKVNVKTKNKIISKRKVYNFKKANWVQLNRDLKEVPWRAITDATDPELAWRNFKNVLFALVNKYIPTITINDNFSAPWFDAECHAAYRKKERAHKKFKDENSLANELKRNHSRRQFKFLCNSKMRDNLYNSDDPALITKKFWSHVKSKSKSARIPECMNLNGVYRNLPLEKAELFNSHFYNQFSDASSYDIDIDWCSDQNFDIDFTESRISLLLASINSNKACGPDGIHGKIFGTDNSLAIPLLHFYCFI